MRAMMQKTSIITHQEMHMSGPGVQERQMHLFGVEMHAPSVVRSAFHDMLRWSLPGRPLEKVACFERLLTPGLKSAITVLVP